MHLSVLHHFFNFSQHHYHTAALYPVSTPSDQSKNSSLETHIRGNSYNKSQRDALFLKFILVKNSKCFRQIYCPPPGVSTLYTQQ